MALRENKLTSALMDTPSVREMAEEVLRDLTQHFQINTSAWSYDLLHRLAMVPARKIARVLHTIDQKVRSHPIWEVARDILPRFTKGLEITGGLDVPREGPLLVVGNHPGAMDSVAALAALERQDVRVLANERPTLTTMPNASHHFFFLDAKNPVRIDVMRGLIEILKRGETVMMFPRGTLEPEPALYTGALDSLKAWSDSLGVFLSRVPETMLQLALTKNVITPQAWQYPLASLAKENKIRHQIAMLLQLLAQELFGIWKQPIQLALPKPVPARSLDRDLDPRALNIALKRYVAAEMEKFFDLL